MPDQSGDSGRPDGVAKPGPARLYALAAGGFLALLGVLGFFFDAGFDTGTKLAADDVAGIIVVNGWRNVVYLASGLTALAFAARHPRRTAGALGAFYAVIGIWGVLETDMDIGSILEVLPLTDNDNIFHLVLGGLGLLAALVEGPLPAPRKRKTAKRRDPARAKPKPASKRATG